MIINKIKNRIKLCVASNKLPIYYRMPAQSCNIQSNCDNETKAIFVTVAFNCFEVIYYQNELLRKFCGDKYRYCIADNSTNKFVSEKIESYCKAEKIDYMRLPKNPYVHVDTSFLHGATLNWIFRNYIGKLKVPYFAILDHDIFPIAPFSVEQKVSAGGGYWGCVHLHTINDKWQFVRKIKHPLPKEGFLYFWPGLFFGELKKMDARKVDFRPAYGGDTGSGNFYKFYCDFFYKKGLLADNYAKREVKWFWEDKQQNLQNSGYEIRDGAWAHMCGASHWKPLTDWQKKEDLFYALLDDTLRS